MEYILFISGAGAFSCAWNWVSGVIERKKENKILEYLNSKKIASVDEILSNSSSPDLISGLISKNNSNEFDILFKGNLDTKNKNYLEIKDEEDNPHEVLLKVKKIFHSIILIRL